MSKEKKNSSLSKEISFGKKTAKWPSKTSMNFVSDEQAKTNRKALIGFVIFLVLLVPFTYFGVISMIQKVSDAEAKYNTLQAQVTALNETTADYAEVKEKYDAITGSYMTTEELANMNRLDILTMIEEDIKPSITVTSISISGSKVSIQSGSTNLATVSDVIVKLQADKRNQYVTVTTTSASSDKNSVIASFEITYATTSTGGTN